MTECGCTGCASTDCSCMSSRPIWNHDPLCLRRIAHSRYQNRAAEIGVAVIELRGADGASRARDILSLHARNTGRCWRPYTADLGTPW